MKTGKTQEIDWDHVMYVSEYTRNDIRAYLVQSNVDADAVTLNQWKKLEQIINGWEFVDDDSLWELPKHYEYATGKQLPKYDS